jgi:CBS domain-containing protein
MAKKVRDVMTQRPTSVSPSQPIQEVARIMRDEDVGSLPVVDGEQVTGIVTDRDIVVRGLAEGRDVNGLTVQDVASRGVQTVEADAELDEALRVMASHQVRRVPVVEGGRLVGVLAQADVAEHGDDRQTGQLVEDISR